MIRRLRNFPIRRIEHIFDDGGLPLVAKSSPELHTTSILVRGGPGTGKTTLALALGQGIAADGGGTLVYLTTEFSPAELRFKAEILRLEERGAQIWAWDGSAVAGNQPATPGTVFVSHISPPSAPEDRELVGTEASSAYKKQSILEAAWRLLAIDSGEKRPRIAGTPVRALVIDAFILPDYGKDDASVRSDLVAFIQALETVGVTPVLVEEVAPDSPSWFPFIVDIVFQLSHEKLAIPAGEWKRTLTCAKSRYALVNAGPHAYSLVNGTPALFPKIRSTAEWSSTIQNTLRFALPRGSGVNQWHVVSHGCVILDSTGVESFSRVVAETPDATVLHVRFGFPVSISGAPGTWIVGDSEGPSVLAWGLIDAVSESKANLVILHDLSRILRQEAWQLPIQQLLGTLRQLGLVVLIVDDYGNLEALAPEADIMLQAAVKPSAEPRIRVRRLPSESFAPRALVSGLRPAARRHDPPFDSSALAASLRPMQPSPMWLLACGWVAGNLDTLNALEKAIQSDPQDHAHLVEHLVRARTRWEGVEAAETCVRRLLPIVPGITKHHGHSQRIEAEIRIDRDEPEIIDRGIEILRALLARPHLPARDLAEVHYNLALALQARGNRDGARAALSVSLKHEPRLDPALTLWKSLGL